MLNHKILLNAQTLDENYRWYQDHSKMKYENDQVLQNLNLEQAIYFPAVPY